ncbi:anti-sigma factor [Effusibacillus lacus]|uniref:Anti-sigma-W factor RsiW n=1 Tax=Effusibacillus lacus TaxID=1348429 RepID=A0A292YNB0_9BACL|nr:anti-sigma factor [Effusibacillus lacus]TCS76064.1 putative zinc finger protein [Effusibacillus lacus]GAX91418.1 hypothetical protein EFBL_3087 [Effusibacillus lacus]
MNNLQDHTCSQCLSYLFGQLSDQERELFEAHLPECEDCRHEIAELQLVTDALPYTAEPVPVPDNLKERTLRTAFAAKAPFTQNKPESQGYLPPSSGGSAWRSFVANRYGKLVMGLVAGLTVALGVSFWQISEYQAQLQTAPNNKPASTTKVERSFPLYAAGDTSKALGTAYLTETANGIQLVVQVQNVSPLSGEQAYQVWLLKNGQRQNAGTFRVNDKGEGVLIYAMDSTKPDFDNIGITKEPDANGTSPRGPKVMGTIL